MFAFSTFILKKQQQGKGNDSINSWPIFETSYLQYITLFSWNILAIYFKTDTTLLCDFEYFSDEKLISHPPALKVLMIEISQV